MITFKVDEIVPCLKDIETGDLLDTEVVRIGRKSVLTKYNKRSGWYVNWSNFSDETEIYALVLKGTVDVQGLIAVQYDTVAKAVYLVWACVAPHNNIWQYGKKKYSGVGGHLLAMASELSVKKGFDGFIYAEAMDEQLLDYYVKQFGALHLPPLNNPFRFMLSDEVTAKLREVYSYDWTNDII